MSILFGNSSFHGESTFSINIVHAKLGQIFKLTLRIFIQCLFMADDSIRRFRTYFKLRSLREYVSLGRLLHIGTTMVVEVEIAWGKDL